MQNEYHVTHFPPEDRLSFLHGFLDGLMAWKETVGTVEALRDGRLGLDIVSASMRGIETEKQSNSLFTETIFCKGKASLFYVGSLSSSVEQS